MDSFIFQHLEKINPLFYVVIFFAMIVEGEATLFIAAFLAKLGYFEILPLFIAVFWGMNFGDNLWYMLGAKIKESASSKFQNRVKRIAEPFDDHIKNRPFRTIFMSKFTYGFNRAILVRAGMLKIKWKFLEESDILATLLWIAIIGGLGYFSGASFVYAKKYFKLGEVFLLVSVALFFGSQYFISRASRKNL